MKEIRNLLGGIFIGGGLIVGLHLLHAQETAMPVQNGVASRDVNSMSDTEVLLQTIESVSPVPAESIPRFGTFYSAQHAPDTRLAWPPLPGNGNQLPAWNLGDGVYLLDDRNLDYDELAAEADLEAALSAKSPLAMRSMMAMNLSSSYAYGNPVYLTNMAAVSYGYGNMTASFSIAGGTNFVPYDILMSTDIAISISQWNWLGIGYTSNRYTFNGQPAGNAFYVLAKPSKTMTVGFGSDTVGQCDVPYGLTNALQVAGAGVTGAGAHSLALKNDGTVVAWGENLYGEGSVPMNLAAVAMVTAGWYHNVALFTNGTVTAWGFSLPSFGYPLTNVPPDLTNVTVISAQALHTLALRKDGTVVAWGYNQSGQTNVPTGLSNVTAISAGYQFSLAVSNGTVVGWGDNTCQQYNPPAGLSNVVDVAAGVYHSVALLNNGTVVAWGRDDDGETDVPAGLSNVVAIAAGGDPDYPGFYTAYSMALKSDGTVVAWGDDEAADPVGGLNDGIGIAAGGDHALAIRTGPPTPVIMLEPVDQYQVAGGNVTFTARGAGLYGVTYRWQTNGVNLSGATNATLTLTNVQAAQQENYRVIVSNNYGSITSSVATFTLITPPLITAITQPTNQFVFYQSDLTFSVTVSAPGQSNGFPISYQWQFNGTNIPNATSSSYTFAATLPGAYSVVITSAAGSTNVSWQVNVLYPGGVTGWGDDSEGQCDPPPSLTNAAVIATGEYHSVAVKEDGSVVQWGYDWGDIPANLTNAISVATGYEHSIALRSDGTVVTWGYSNCPGNVVPSNLAGVKAVAAGWLHSVVLLTNGTVRAWGDNYYGQTNVPPDLTNVTAISACSRHNLALKSDGTVEGWGYNYDGITTTPTGLSNVVAIATGYVNSLALKADGTVVVWGDNSAGQCNVPTGLSNVMALAAGWYHCAAMKNDGTVVSWGDNSAGQTNVPAALVNAKLLAAAGSHTLAGVFSPLVQYPVDVTKDVLLIYNSNSTNSVALKDYYLAHRPMITGINVLSIACDAGESTTSTNCNAQIMTPVLNWLTNNPTKRPQYVILSFEIPTRLSDLIVNGNLTTNYGNYGSVSYHLHNNLLPGWQPFVNNLNANTLADCEGYVHKLEFIGTNCSPGKLIISASAGGYGNTNFYPDGFESSYFAQTYNALIASGASSNSIISHLPTEPPITNGVNVAGYASTGFYRFSGDRFYPIDGKLKWSGNSGWWIIVTGNSFSGIRDGLGIQDSFTEWFASNAFGGTNYSCTPIGATGATEEPGGGTQNDARIYFPFWQSRKNFAICAWNSRQTPYFQAIGDPLITR